MSSKPRSRIFEALGRISPRKLSLGKQSSSSSSPEKSPGSSTSATSPKKFPLFDLGGSRRRDSSYEDLDIKTNPFAVIRTPPRHEQGSNSSRSDTSQQEGHAEVPHPRGTYTSLPPWMVSPWTPPTTPPKPPPQELPHPPGSESSGVARRTRGMSESGRTDSSRGSGTKTDKETRSSTPVEPRRSVESDCPEITRTTDVAREVEDAVHLYLTTVSP
ncbi:hypothetical protein FRB99_002888 [Tulasnella sp. 403]|nr:hypothetical protein FRB99_002888 [Tulasnella sp. 403]